MPALRAAGHYFQPLLDEHGYRKLFLGSKAEKQLTWSKYRKVMFEHQKNTQGKAGSWAGGH